MIEGEPDTQTFLAPLDRFVDAGNTILVIEHDLDVVEHADWIIDLGPGGGGARDASHLTRRDLLDEDRPAGHRIRSRSRRHLPPASRRR